jgi:hypothetical protein
MPLTKINYNTNASVIYKIYCIDSSCCYIYFGSTTNFTKRKQQHKYVCHDVNQKEYNFKLYETIRANGGWDNWEMALVEIYPCEIKGQLLIREQFYIDQQIDKINDRRAYISEEDRKKNEVEHNKQYRIDNKEKIKQYRIDNKEKRKQYRIDNKERQKQYYLDNKEHILEQQKQYYLDKKKLN